MLKIFCARIILVMISIITLAGCNLSGIPKSQREGTSTTSLEIQSTTTQGYPAPNETPPSISFESGYPAPETTQSILHYPNQISIPTASAGQGIVTGQLVIKNEESSPYLAPSLYLGPAVEANEQKFPPLISLDVEIDLKAIQDKTGKFVFSGVKPGKYGLIIWSPFSQTVILDPNNEGFPLIIEVTPGDIIDLGMIEIP